MLRRLGKGLHQQLLLPLAAFFQPEFQGGLLAQLLLEPQQDAGQLVLLDGLEQVILHAVFQGGLGVFKFPVSADDDKVQIGLQLLCPPDQLDPAVSRHPDVGDEKMGLLFAHQLQGPQAVVGGSNDLIAQRLPVDQLLHQQNDFVLVIRQDNSQHTQVLRYHFCIQGAALRHRSAGEALRSDPIGTS